MYQITEKNGAIFIIIFYSSISSFFVVSGQKLNKWIYFITIHILKKYFATIIICGTKEV